MRIQFVQAGSPAIYTCEKEEYPSGIAQLDPQKQTQLTFYYVPEQDAIVLNKDHKNFEHLKELLIAYLEFNDLQKKEFLVMPREMGMTFFDSINEVLRIRRKIKKHKQKSITSTNRTT